MEASLISPVRYASVRGSGSPPFSVASPSLPPPLLPRAPISPGVAHRDRAAAVLPSPSPTTSRDPTAVVYQSASSEMDLHSHNKANEGLIGDNPDAYAVTTYQPVLMVEPSAAAAFPPAPKGAPVYPVNPMQLPEHQQHAFQQVQQLQQQQLQAFWADQMAEVEQMTEFKLPNLPLARIKKIMKADEDVKMIAGEAPALFAKACEMFILDLTLRSWQHTEEGRRRTLQRSDVEAVIKKTDIFDFLVDIFPDDHQEDGVGSQAASMVSPYSPGAMAFPFELYQNQHHLAYMWHPQEQQEQWPPQEQQEQEQKQQQDSDGGGQDE